MAIKRSNNIVNQQRVDTSTMRSIESAVRSDFDDLLSGLITGIGHSYIVNGFELNMTGAIGSSAAAMQVIVASGSILHGTSSVSGTTFLVPSTTPNETLSSTTNTKVTGSFTPSAANYVGIEFNRAVDNTTTGQVYLWNPSSNSEYTKTIPLAETLNYKFVIASSIYASNVLPLAIITTDSSNNVISVEDRRPMLFRLGTAGSATPNTAYTYPWNHHAEGRVENAYTSSSSATSPFRGGDKQIQNMKEWFDSVMSAVQEIKGTTYWYGANTGGSILKMRGDLANLMMTGKGNISHSATVSGRINWSEDIFFNFIGSRISYNINSNAATTHITLADDQVAYVKFVRGVDIIPNIIFTNGSAVVTSVGAVSWTNNVLAGDFIKDTVQDDTKYYKILSVDSASQATLTEVFGEVSTGASGISAQYAWGSYQTNVAPSTDRHVKTANRKDVPFTEDIYWLFVREDNTGSLARVYIRGSGFGELEKGETRQISDNTSQAVLDYTGSPSETQANPDYTNAYGTAVHEIFTVTIPAAAAITTGQSFVAYSAKDLTKHYFWYNKDAGGGDPLIIGAFGYPIVISTGDVNTVVAAATQAVMNAVGYFNTVDNLNGTITATLSQVGTATDAANVNVGGLTILVNTQGVGSPNYYIADNDNLTKGLKSLDMQIGGLIASVTEKGYEEFKTVVAGAPANTNQITGPVVTLTTFNIPLNSRNSNVQQSYIVGAGTLAVYLNGQRLNINSDYNEIGVLGSQSIQIQNIIQLEIDDVVDFKIEGKGAGSNGGGSTYTASNLGTASNANVFKQQAGTEFQFRRLTAGTGVSITENTNDIILAAVASVAPASGAVYAINHVMLSTDDVALANTAGGNVMFTLPSASSVPGKIYYFKKTSASNTMYIKAVLSQTLDGIDIDAAPMAVTVQYQSVTITSVSDAWWIL